MRYNYPRAAFWRNNPYWARWRWTTPYRWTSWAALSSWSAWGWSSAAPYSYGENVYYQGGDVYYGENPVATEEEYALQAQALATSVPEVTEAEVAEASEDDWLPLGVFALTEDGEASGPPPSMFLQLAVSKEGVIAGTFHKSDSEDTAEVEGAVDKKNQRTAWGPAGKDWPIMETGLATLTEDTGPALVHFANGQTQQWLLVRVEEPTE
ncbi:MAG: hypothetical protein AAF961_08635 [Planctomycetota bacterium]